MRGGAGAAGSRWIWTALALATTIAVQAISAIPEPGYFAAEDPSDGLEASLSRVVFAPGETLLNLLHLPVFALVGWLWCRAAATWAGARRQALAAGAAVATLFAVGNEISQHYVPTRHASGIDALVDLVGVALGVWLYGRGLRPLPPVAAASPRRLPER